MTRRIAASIASLALLVAAPLLAPGAVRAPGVPEALVALPQERAAWAAAANDLGEVDADVALSHLTLLLERPAERQAAFEELLREQQDPASPNFHRWLTPLEVGERFGPAVEDIEAVASWLRAQGLQVDGVSNSRVRIRFSGGAAELSSAFATPLHAYLVDGEARIAPASPPRVPAAIAAIVHSVHGLEGVRDRPHEHSSVQAATGRVDAPKSTTCTNGVCTHFMWPGDFAAIYNLNPVYQGGITGAGQTIAVIGRSNVNMADIENFQKRSGLAIRDPVVIVPPDGIDPGPPQSTQVDTPSKEQSEVTLDVTRAGSVAPGAAIILVVSANAKTVSGLGVAGQYVVDTTPLPAQVMTISFGACEHDAGSSSLAFWDSVFSQAAAEGISVFVSSGDSGIAGCDAHHVAPPADPQVASPNYICSSSFATCVGGTQFADTDNPDAYWRSANAANFVSAIGYIPEGGWNEPINSAGDLQVAASGGGVSGVIPTPFWQKGPGVPGTAGRYTPDVSFSAAAHDAYAKCFAAAGGDCVSDATGRFRFATSSGTSAAAPSMAGVAALLNQKMGAPQGHLNPRLYALAATAGNGVFHDVTVATSGVVTCDLSTPSLCNNATPGAGGLNLGLAGYSVGPGYDLVTGLGSMDVANLLGKWSSVTTAPPPNANFQGLWWASPAGSESGWGINFAHQGDTIFASWFTYGALGAGNWMVMTAPKTAANTYSGTLYTTTGPAFNSVPFVSGNVVATPAGTATVTFTGANDGVFSYIVGGASQSKPITRQVFGTLPTCAPTAAASLAAATNYTDLWWASPAGSESGWGVNLTHQGTTLFASWFTYDTNLRPMWLVATAAPAGANSYSGTLFRTTGPPFSATPFNSASVVATSVGNATFTFSDGNNATFAYTVNGISQSKAITRQVFGSSATACH